MELTLPTKVNVTHPIMLDTKILVVIGANGAGKSSFGRDLLEFTVYDQRTTVHATYF